MIINIVFNINFVMSEIEEKNDYENMDQTPNWTNLVCPSCAIYYGVQLLISSIKKRKNQRSILLSSKNN